jgi:S1-C subfamily serine protease
VIELEVVPPTEKPLPVAPGGPRLGERVVLVGNPGYHRNHLLWVADTGTVVGLGGDAGKQPNTRQLFPVRTEDRVRKGYSGGPVVNASGELVGVMAAAYPTPAPYLFRFG